MNIRHSIASLALLSSCATMVNTPRPILLTSDPSGATVTTSDGQAGVTPIAITPMDPKQEFVATFKLDGYETAMLSSRPKIHGAVLVNLLWGVPGVAFFLVDVSSSGSRYYPDRALSAALVPTETTGVNN